MENIILLASESEPSALSTIISIVISLIMLAAQWMLFQKAGEEGWKVLIPIYNAYKFMEIITGNGFKFLFFFIPLFNVIYMIMCCFKLAGAYGKGILFGFGILFLPYVFLPILAFGDSYYCGPQ